MKVKLGHQSTLATFPFERFTKGGGAKGLQFSGEAIALLINQFIAGGKFSLFT
ncbi:hypothetical protein [Coleofasciculus sp. E1-EBD-02]|uniref:hypothetical protein n=1 Tax=Coleofasciculus sp. E1-EBD-02 TaxID=3068481 RepID=UPI0040643F8F